MILFICFMHIYDYVGGYYFFTFKVAHGKQRIGFLLYRDNNPAKERRVSHVAYPSLKVTL